MYPSNVFATQIHYIDFPNCKPRGHVSASGDIDGYPDKPIRVAIVGTGLIGQVHARVARDVGSVELCALSGLDDGAAALASEVEAQLLPDYRDLAKLNLDGVIIAAPNHLHLPMAEFFADNGIHLLVEKPIADSMANGVELCRAAERNGVHVLIGHHRRYHSLVRAAERFVANDLGRLVATNTLVTMRKPDSYYSVDWRRGEGAGPLLVNLIHEVDLLRAVCGEIDSVQAAGTDVNRGFAFDDTATVMIRYASGALGTLIISESTPSPWSWEASVSDGMGFHNAGQDHAQFIGSEASLSFPSLTAWRYDPADADPGWTSALQASRIGMPTGNPYENQIEHFARLIQGLEQPRVSGRDGLRSLAVVNAVIEAARTGEAVSVDRLLADL